MTQAETRGTVLVIDDEESVVDIARRTLERHGYSVLTAGDGHEATMVFRDNAERINAVLLDMTMPRMSGADVFVQIRGIRPDVPITVASGHDIEEFNALLEQPPAVFLPKPYHPQELIDVLVKLLGKSG